MPLPALSWSFYGRRAELAQMRAILDRRRWFFLQISGRRRIGKTTLIQEALNEEERSRALYIQIPDSDPAGVVAACNGYLETFGMAERVSDLGDLAKLIGRLVAGGRIVAIDKFQYFHRKLIAAVSGIKSMDVVLPVERGAQRTDLRLRVVAKPEPDTAQLLAHLGLQIPRQAKFLPIVVPKTA